MGKGQAHEGLGQARIEAEGFVCCFLPDMENSSREQCSPSKDTPNPSQLGTPQLPILWQPIGIDKPGEKFMRVVFEKLKGNGDVGVAPNADRSVYYVARVKNREPATAAGMEALRQDFLQQQLFGTAVTGATSYDHLANGRQQQMFFEWSQHFFEKYAVRGLSDEVEE